MPFHVFLLLRWAGVDDPEPKHIDEFFGLLGRVGLIFFSVMLKLITLNPTMHYAARAMGAMTLRISELCLSFSPHPNISDGNVNLVHHFFRIQIFQINGKGPS